MDKFVVYDKFFKIVVYVIDWKVFIKYWLLLISIFKKMWIGCFVVCCYIYLFFFVRVFEVWVLGLCLLGLLLCYVVGENVDFCVVLMFDLFFWYVLL